MAMEAMEGCSTTPMVRDINEYGPGRCGTSFIETKSIINKFIIGEEMLVLGVDLGYNKLGIGSKHNKLLL